MSKDGNVINIMHLSDIHCGADDNKKPAYCIDRKEAIESFHRDFYKIRNDWRPDIIVITGDLGWAGRESDYDEFSSFLKKLLEETGLTIEKVICCPGNHDKYIPETHIFPRKIKGASKYHSVNDIWENLEPLANNFMPFSQKLKEIGIKPLCNNSDIELTKYLYGYRIIDGICFTVLNSAWLCDWRKDKKNYRADKGQLLIDNNIVCEMASQVSKALPIIVMYHHPNEWLRESEISCTDGHPVTVNRIEQLADIILNGHTHEPRENSSRHRLQYTSGTISSNDTYKSQCFLLRAYINSDDPELSYVNEGQYYSEWVEGKISWSFKGESKPKWFNVLKQLEKSEREVEEKDKEIEAKKQENKELRERIEKQKDTNKELESAFGIFLQHLEEMQQRVKEQDKRVESIKIQAQTMKALAGKRGPEQDLAEMERLYEEIKRSIQVLSSELQIDIADVLSLLEDVWQAILQDTIDDVEVKEQSKQIVKSLSLGPASLERDEG